MQKALITILILICSSLSHSETASYVLYNKEGLCDAASYYASLAFEGHQKGEEKKEYLEMIDESKEIPSAKKNYFKRLLNDAYRKPIYSSEEAMKSARLKFNDNTYKNCMKPDSSASK